GVHSLRVAARVVVAKAPGLLVTLPLSLHDALPICVLACPFFSDRQEGQGQAQREDHGRVGHVTRIGPDHAHGSPSGADGGGGVEDRKSTRLNSSHVSRSYAVFCLKKKRTTPSPRRR